MVKKEGQKPLLVKRRSENKLQHEVEKCIKDKCGKVFTWKLADRFKVGLPDMIVVYNGKCCFLEFKSEKGKVTPIQGKVLNDLADNGAFCYIIQWFKNDKVKMVKYAGRNSRYDGVYCYFTIVKDSIEELVDIIKGEMEGEYDVFGIPYDSNHSITFSNNVCSMGYTKISEKYEC